MSRFNRHTVLGLAAVAVAGGSWMSTARAAQTLDTTVDVYDSVDNDFIAGSGVPIDHFVQDSVPSAGQSVSVAVKPRDRDTGQANYIAGNKYFVDPGQSTSNPARPNLAFDFQFDPGTDGATNYQLRLSVDFNPAVGNTAASDFTVIQLPIFDADGIPDGTFDSWIDSDGYYLTDTSGQFGSKQNKAWNDSTVPYVITNTTNHTFLPVPAGFPYDSNTPGEYEIRLEALDASGTTVLASANAFAVVPEPAGLSLLALGAVMLLGRRRRKPVSVA